MYIYFKIENTHSADKYQILDSNCFQGWTGGKCEKWDSHFYKQQQNIMEDFICFSIAGYLISLLFMIKDM